MTTVYTIGHSNRPIETFIALLREHDIELLVDIRTVPKSRHNPQFGQDRLPGSLEEAGIRYQYMQDLGGLRKSTADSPNGGWRNTSFRGYADWMQTDQFASAVVDLIRLAESVRTAIMCAEAVPWRCHRSLVGDALLVRGVEVIDIMGNRSARKEKLTPFAVVDGTSITYPPYEDEDAATA
jgi:uncharacterized protein (DUF488 family)